MLDEENDLIYCGKLNIEKWELATYLWASEPNSKEDDKDRWCDISNFSSVRDVMKYFW